VPAVHGPPSASCAARPSSIASAVRATTK
jgi:hypothetical protein